MASQEAQSSRPGGPKEQRRPFRRDDVEGEGPQIAQGLHGGAMANDDGGERDGVKRSRIEQTLAKTKRIAEDIEAVRRDPCDRRAGTREEEQVESADPRSVGKR
jgi:hypothetical protein